MNLCAALLIFSASIAGEAGALPLPEPALPAEGLNERTDRSLVVWFHQTFISPQDGDTCVFDPTCSAYAQQALNRYGPLGWAAASERLLRCHRGNAPPRSSPLLRAPDPLPRETPWSVWGGALSAAAPGLGQAAGGRWKDGLRAFAQVSALAAGAVYYARRGRNLSAAAAGGAALFFYAGNLLGGAKALAP